MTAIFVSLTALIIALTLVQLRWDYLVKYVSRDGRTNEHKKLRKGVVVLAGALFILNQVAGTANSFKKDKTAENERTNLLAKITTLESNQSSLTTSIEKERKAHKGETEGLRAQLTDVNSNQLELLQQNRTLVSALSTNTNLDSKMRMAIVESNRKFEIINSEVVDVNAWMNEFDSDRATSQIARDEANQKRREIEDAIFRECLPLFDYSIRKLHTVLSDLATQKGESIASTFTTLPPSLNSNGVSVAHITLGTNNDWTFDVTMTKGVVPARFSPPSLSIVYRGNSTNSPRGNFRSSVITMTVRPNLVGNEVRTSVRVAAETLNDNGPITDFKKTIDKAIRRLVAGRAEQIRARENGLPKSPKL